MADNTGFPRFNLWAPAFLTEMLDFLMTLLEKVPILFRWFWLLVHFLQQRWACLDGCCRCHSLPYPSQLLSATRRADQQGDSQQQWTMVPFRAHCAHPPHQASQIIFLFTWCALNHRLPHGQGSVLTLSSSQGNLIWRKDRWTNLIEIILNFNFLIHFSE